MQKPKTINILAVAAGVAAFFFVKKIGQPLADKIDAKMAEPKAIEQ